MSGLPLDSWLLLLVSVGVGFALEALFLRVRRSSAAEDARPSGSGDEGHR